ncbi:hypothetical protein B0T09DRAFT_373461 [Sordaria sp. MPI-SDFR-AT-0083]|nr:hypothetical protein B0T09DRAFT_373461 [Sordaria sp. MPI-SDFR-AT-0083]
MVSRLGTEEKLVTQPWWYSVGWVWYPEGYWAEREFRLIDFAATSSNRTPEIKVWKWRRRSRKTGSGSLDNDAPTVSPKTNSNPPQQQPPASSTTPSSPQSRFRTEEAHILALQSPGVQLMTSTSLVESEWLAPKHSLQTPRLLDPYPAQATSDVPTESRGSPGFLSKRGISALSVLQKTKDKAKKYSSSGPASERRSGPIPDLSKDGSIVLARRNSGELELNQTPEKEESRRASRLSYIRFPRRAWSERRSFHSTSGGTAAVAESATTASSSSSVSGLRTAFSVIPPVRTTSQYPGGVSKGRSHRNVMSCIRGIGCFACYIFVS